MKAPDFDVIDHLFPPHRISFGFEEDQKDTYFFYLDAGEKISRKEPTTSSSPNEVTPLWYGFVFEYADELSHTNASNVDFTGLLKGGLKRPAADQPCGQPDPKKT